MNKQVLILGGGAAGLLAGAYLARSGLSASILEKAPRVGKKLAATGNGRCNLTNLHAAPADYGVSAAFVRPALEAFPPAAVTALFEEMGVVCVPDEEGRVYPMSNQASSVLDVLRAEFAEHGGEEIVDFCVSGLSRRGDLWHVRSADGRTMAAPRILVALGGQAAPNLGGTPDGIHLLRDLGYRAKPCFPALTPLKCDHPRLKSLKGIRAAGSVALCIDEKIVASETGEILFQDYGLSGIAVMQLSGTAAQALSKQKRVALRLNLCGLSKRRALAQLAARREALSARPLENFLTGWMNKRLGQTLLKIAGCNDLLAPSGTLSDAQLDRLAETMTGWMIPVTASAGYAQAQVTRGGIDTAEFFPETMLSRRHPGLYIAGELLDVDGPCGGYNLQWAWASALAACRDMLNA